MLKYLELKTGYHDDGPAWIGYVLESKSRRSIYFNGKCYAKSKRSGGGGNYFDIETKEAYWISGIKKSGSNRHWAGSGKITIEASAVEEFLQITGRQNLDPLRFVVSHSIKPTDRAKFHELENRKVLVKEEQNGESPNQAL